MPLEQTVCRPRFYVKAVQNRRLFSPLLSGERYAFDEIIIMNELIDGNLNQYFCILPLVGRLGDIISTYIATPKLKLEANPIIRKLK